MRSRGEPERNQRGSRAGLARVYSTSTSGPVTSSRDRITATVFAPTVTIADGTLHDANWKGLLRVLVQCTKTPAAAQYADVPIRFQGVALDVAATTPPEGRRYPWYR